MERSAEFGNKQLKSMLSSEPFLHLPDLSKTYMLKIDASDVGSGAVLL